MTFTGLDSVIHHPEDVEMIHELRTINADLLEALEAVEPWFSSLIQTEIKLYDTELYDKLHTILVKAQHAIRDAR